MINDDILSMPDKWEYPWYAAWDLAFHTLALSVGRSGLRQGTAQARAERTLPPSQRPGPRLRMELQRRQPAGSRLGGAFSLSHGAGRARRGRSWNFLKSAFTKLLLNFTWWVNRKDRFGKNVFEGGFLGLDNISVFDRSAPLPTGGNLEQADGTAWMALFCQNMGELAVELAVHDPAYVDLAATFADHFLWIAAAMNKPGADGMWDEEDGFYYDLLRLPGWHLDPAQGALDGRSAAAMRDHGDRTVAARADSAHRAAFFKQRLKQMPERSGVDSSHRSGSFRSG